MKSFFTTHPVMKAISLALAFVLWMLVRGEQRTERKYQVAVRVVNPPAHLVVAEDYEPSITIALTGPRSRLSGLDESYFKPFVVDLSDAARGVNTFWVTEERLRIPRGTEVSRISPQRIRVRMERAEERMVRVEPRYVGQLEEGFEMLQYEVEPKYLKVRGSRQELSALRSLRTEPISLTGRSSSFEGTFDVYGLDPHWELDVKDVRVRIVVAEQEVSKVLEDVPVKVAGAPGPVKVEPSTVTLKARGPFRTVASLLAENPSVEVDAAALELALGRRSTAKTKPILPKRPGVEITMIPDNVRVTLVREKSP